MAIHAIEPERRTLHGPFSRDVEPVLTIEPGDTVRYRTLDAGWHLALDPTPETIGLKFEPRDPERDRGHAMCGPVAIRGAEPGMTLQIEIGEIRPGSWGWTWSGGGESEVGRRLGLDDSETLLLWTLDPDAGIGRNQFGRELALRPFMGVMGMPPDESGFFSTAPPRPTGGNIDCKELVAGSTLYLPIAVAGALFSVGDGHATQGDGEVSGTAIECPMDRVDLTFRLRDDLQLTTPLAETAIGWMTFGFDEDLDVATLIAIEAMIDLLRRQYGMDVGEALAMASLTVDMRITQIVNGVKGVHAVLPHGVIR